MAQLEAMADEEEANAMAEAQDDDFETYKESEFGEGDEYEDGQVLQLTAERNDSLAQFNEHHDSVYCVDSLPVAPFDLMVSGDGADKAYVWRLSQLNNGTSPPESDGNDMEEEKKEEVGAA